MSAKPIQNCFCGSDKAYENCCGQLIETAQAAENPEQLMRSRYSAYVLKNETYLLQTWHESTRPSSLNLKSDSTHWEKLKIIAATDSSVHFVAYFTQNNLNEENIFALTEKSQFIKENNWLYLEGDEVETIKLTKNRLCPCQSGKKYKRCCSL